MADFFSDENNRVVAESPTKPSARSLTTHTVCGEISRVVFENDDGTYSVLRLVDNQGVEHTIVGGFSGVYEGQSMEATGYWEQHREFGRQLKASSFRFILPSTKEGITRYLASGIISGIGPKLAKCIVDFFGDRTLEILDHYPARLKEIPGIGKKRVGQIRIAWQEQAARRDIFIFLQGLGISPLYCQKIYRIYGDAAPAVVKENPYRLAEDVDGIGFLMADRIAGALGIQTNDAARLKAGADYTMKQLVQLGHCCYPADGFVAKCAETLRVEPPEAARGVSAAIEQRLLIAADEMVYSSALFKLENELPELIYRLAVAANHHGRRLGRTALPTNIKFSREQLSAVELIGNYPLSIITGGPGVGKTTVVGEIVRRALAAKIKFSLAAPTGRAAKRMAESTGCPARTIHRLLKWDPGRGGFVYNQLHHLPCQLLIVDEVSMLDLVLATALFRAIEPGTTVVLVGDADQLPSVGPGTILHSFLGSGFFAVTHLNNIFRQGEGSNIIVNAHRINQGTMPVPAETGNRNLSDFYWLRQDDPEKTLQLILKMVCERIPRRFGLNPTRDIQVLTPMNRGLCGTHSLNQRLQEALNPGPKPQFKIGERIFRAGDKVMQTSNNYDKNVFNGDMGRIGEIDYENKRFKVFFDDAQVAEYDFAEADQITLSYAVTVHKSQGSEFSAVVMPLLTQHYMMLQRNLLYTGVTRARRLLVLIGSGKAVGIATRNARLEPRFSRLAERLLKLRVG